MKTNILLVSILSILFLFSCKENKAKEKVTEKESKKTEQSTLDSLIKKDKTYFKKGDKTLKAMNNIVINCNNENAELGFQIIHQHCVKDNNFNLLGNFITKYDASNKETILEKIIVKMDRKNTIYYVSKVIKKRFDPKNRIKEIIVHLTKSEDTNAKTLVINEPIKNNDILDIHILKPDMEALGDTQCPTEQKSKDNINYNFCASLISCK